MKMKHTPMPSKLRTLISCSTLFALLASSPSSFAQLRINPSNEPSNSKINSQASSQVTGGGDVGGGTGIYHLEVDPTWITGISDILNQSITLGMVKMTNGQWKEAWEGFTSGFDQAMARIRKISPTLSEEETFKGSLTYRTLSRFKGYSLTQVSGDSPSPLTYQHAARFAQDLYAKLFIMKVGIHAQISQNPKAKNSEKEGEIIGIKQTAGILRWIVDQRVETLTIERGTDRSAPVLLFTDPYLKLLALSSEDLRSEVQHSLFRDEWSEQVQTLSEVLQDLNAYLEQQPGTYGNDPQIAMILSQSRIRSILNFFETYTVQQEQK